LVVVVVALVVVVVALVVVVVALVVVGDVEVMGVTYSGVSPSLPKPLRRKSENEAS